MEAAWEYSAPLAASGVNLGWFLDLLLWLVLGLVLCGVEARHWVPVGERVHYSVADGAVRADVLERVVYGLGGLLGQVADYPLDKTVEYVELDDAGEKMPEGGCSACYFPAAG